MLAPKPDDEIRICGNLRNPNKAHIPDSYQLPQMDEQSEFFAGATVFSMIDLKWGYLQVVLAKECRYLTAMIKPNGLYQWTRVPFGLCAAQSSFKKIISIIIDGCPRTKKLLDDIILAGVGYGEHDKNLEMVFQKFTEFNATANASKCSFGGASVECAGHQICKDGVRSLQFIVEALFKIEPPTNVKEVPTFLSTANYYLRFVPYFAEIARPLLEMLKNDAEFYWTDECEHAFDELKREIASNRVLDHFKVKSPITVSKDAACVALGPFLSKLQDIQERAIPFASTALEPNDRAYAVGEREVFPCIWACDHSHYYLYGMKFTIRTPYSALTPILSKSNKGRKSMRLMRWADRLHQYNFKVGYRSGKENNFADMVSRSVQKLRHTIK